jgi:Flp pilus assembly protein TadG
MLKEIALKMKSLQREDKGGVLILVTFCLVPLILMVGLAVDTSLGLEQKRKLQIAADAASKAGMVNGKGAIGTITPEVQKVFAANTADMKNVTGPTVSFDSSTGAVTVTSSISVPTIFMALGGIPSQTYTTTATATPSSNLAEVAIVYEVSRRLRGTYHQNICTALINFVNSLPSNIMVSITPIATDFILDSTNTVPANLFEHLNPTANDESANPAYYPLSSNFIWTEANYNYVGSLYYTNNSFAIFTSYKSPAPTTCPGGYSSCPPLMWPLKCPVSLKTSCSQIYTYISNVSFPILPLTLNKTLIINYLNTLKNYSAKTDGFFPSFVSWGWRTIDPEWNDFWMVNKNLSDQTRITGQYPKPYGGLQKSIILVFNGSAYWDEYEDDVDGYYINPCGDATKVLDGLNHWWMTSYGLVSVPTDYIDTAVDITCENYAYRPMDKVLGLSLTNSTNYTATVNSTTYKSSTLNAVNSKFFRICNNIKSKGVDIYLLAGNNKATLSPCCNSSSNAYSITNSSSSLSTAFNAIKSSIVAKIQ